LGFGETNIEILETAPMWSTRDSINAKLTTDASKTKIFLEFDFLDPGDGFAVQFLADQTTPEARWPHSLQCYGTVKGLNRAPFPVDAGFEKSSWWGSYIALAVASFFAFGATAILSDAWQSGMTMTSVIKILAAILFALIAVISVGVSLSGWTERSFVVPSLLRRSNDPPDDIMPPHVVAQIGSSSSMITIDRERA
jgi:hypothetical protein